MLFASWSSTEREAAERRRSRPIWPQRTRVLDTASLSPITMHKLRAHSGSSNAPHRSPRIHLIAAHQRTAMYTTRAFQQRMPSDSRTHHRRHTVRSERSRSRYAAARHRCDPRAVVAVVDRHSRRRAIHRRSCSRIVRIVCVRCRSASSRIECVSNTTTHAKLMQFLECLDVPTVATFRDSALYTRLAEARHRHLRRRRRCERRTRSAGVEQADALDRRRHVAAGRRSPTTVRLAAPPHYRNAESAEA